MFGFLNRFSLNAAETVEAINEAVKETADMSIKWRPDQFLPNLKYMGIGMLCIFIVIGVIILSIFLVNFCVNRFSKDGKAKKVKKEKNTDENGQNKS